jgi:hypothetical protein
MPLEQIAGNGYLEMVTVKGLCSASEALIQVSGITLPKPFLSVLVVAVPGTNPSSSDESYLAY